MPRWYDHGCDIGGRDMSRAKTACAVGRSRRRRGLCGKLRQLVGREREACRRFHSVNGGGGGGGDGDGNEALKISAIGQLLGLPGLVGRL